MQSTLLVVGLESSLESHVLFNNQAWLKESWVGSSGDVLAFVVDQARCLIICNLNFNFDHI